MQKPDHFEIDLPFKPVGHGAMSMGCGVLFAMTLIGIPLLVIGSENIRFDTTGIGFDFLSKPEGLEMKEQSFLNIWGIISLVLGIAMALYLFLDDYLNKPRRIVISHHGVELELLRKNRRASWDMVKSAIHEEEDSWALKIDDDELVIEEDWFSDSQWQQVVNTLNSLLKAHSIPIQFEPCDEDKEASQKEDQERIAALEARVKELEDQEK